MDVILFGTGRMYEKYKKYFIHENIVAILDNDEKKIGTLKDNIYIQSPAEGIKKQFDEIFILSNSFCVMKQQLISMGVNPNKIFARYDISNLYPRPLRTSILKIYSDSLCLLQHDNKPKIAIVTRGISWNGGDIAVLLMAEVLRKKYIVHIFSEQDGGLRNHFLSLDIPVIIDENLCISHMSDLLWTSNYELIFVNGASLYTLFEEENICSNKNKIIWWIHSSRILNEDLSMHRLNKFKPNQISVFAVSELSRKAVEVDIPSWNINLLSYGLKDVCSRRRPFPKRDKIVFALIGAITPVKGQDYFIKAICKLSKDKRSKCEFLIIGSMNEKNFLNELYKISESIPEIKIRNEINRNELLEQIYPKISVLVCPSLEDSLPIVCAEAMMFYHPCIVSSNTGTAQYIINKKNGLVCNVGDADDLALALEWIISYKNKIDEIGLAARKLYEEHFSINVFENKLFNIVDKMIV